MANVRAFPAAQIRTRALVPSSVLAMMIFVATEVMFFAGLLSAYMVVRVGVPRWPPLGQPRLPVEATAANTVVLLLSGCLLFLADPALKGRITLPRTRTLLGASALLGSVFVLIQGYEWFGLIRFGLTVTSSNYGGFFYLIVGAHALHAVAAVILLLYARERLSQGTLTPGLFQGAQMFWYFVVGVWPILYVSVYLL